MDPGPPWSQAPRHGAWMTSPPCARFPPQKSPPRDPRSFGTQGPGTRGLDGVAWNGTLFVAVGWWGGPAESRDPTYADDVGATVANGVPWTEVLLADSGIPVDSIRGVAWNGTRSGTAVVKECSGGTILPRHESVRASRTTGGW